MIQLMPQHSSTNAIDDILYIISMSMYMCQMNRECLYLTLTAMLSLSGGSCHGGQAAGTWLREL